MIGFLFGNIPEQITLCQENSSSNKLQVHRFKKIHFHYYIKMHKKIGNTYKSQNKLKQAKKIIMKTISPISVSLFNDTSVHNKCTVSIRNINTTVKHSYNE